MIIVNVQVPARKDGKHLVTFVYTLSSPLRKLMTRAEVDAYVAKNPEMYTVRNVGKR